MSALPQPAPAAPDAAPEPGASAELRVLSGCHAGARAPVQGSVLLGAGDGCDIILSDIALAEGECVRLQVVQGRWSVAALHAENRSASASGPDRAANDGAVGGTEPDPDGVPLAPWGQIGTVGGIALTVSAPHAAWQSPVQRSTQARPRAPAQVPAQIPAQAPTPASALSQPAATGQTPALPAPAAPAAATTFAAAPADGPAAAAAGVPARRRAALPLILGLGLALVVLAVGVGLRLWTSPAPVAALPAPSTAAPVLSAAQRQQLLRDIQQALASVDPALRLPVETLPDGRARVSGWVQGVEQLDRVAEALAKVHPLPVLGVRTAADLLDDLRAAASASGAALGFETLGAGRIRVTGTLNNAQEQAQVLAQLRTRVPAGVDLVDGLRVAQSQGPAVQQWLRQAGFEGAQTRWDAESGQLVVNVDIAPGQRLALESLLARPGTLLAGLPFTLRVRESPQAGAAAPVHASAAPLPFRIRGVVGGAAPYVVLGDGSKLQPGGQRAGWRLTQIDPDRLVFDGPRRLVLAR